MLKSRLNHVERWFGIIILASDPAWHLLERLAEGFCEAVGADRQNRALHRQLEQGLSSFQLDCNRRFNFGETPATLLEDFWGVIYFNIALTLTRREDWPRGAVCVRLPGGGPTPILPLRLKGLKPLSCRYGLC